MGKKNEMKIFKADDLLNKLLESPTVDTKEGDDIDLIPIEEILKQNEKDLTEINKYFKDMVLGYKAEKTIINPPEDIETKIDGMVSEIQNYIKKYKITVYTGTTAYWKSKGIAKFLGNDIEYFGHCFAFNRWITKWICERVEEFLEDPKKIDEIMGWIRIILEAYIDEDIVDIIINILYAIIGVIEEVLDELKESRTGMMIFYFDRVDMISKLGDYLDPEIQPSRPWNPKKYYPQTDWIKVWSKD